MGRSGRHAKVIELNRLVQVLLDVDKNAENPFLVDLLGLRLHGVVLCADDSTMRSRLPRRRIACLTAFADFEVT